MSPDLRQESDALGTRDIPALALWGIHTLRAQENFPLALRPVAPPLIHAYGAVKQACCRVNARLGYVAPELAAALESACVDLRSGSLDPHIVVDALQGGAGTSLNMNINEVLANRTLQILGYALGDYQHCDPLDTVNLHQSTNDTFPTALRLAGLYLLRGLESAVVEAQEACQDLERQLADVVCVARTQLQDAVLLTLGRQFGAYADALGRDRWRVQKCAERLRTVNLGGTAVGTGLGAPRRFIFAATDELRALTGLPLSRAENLVDATANQDALVEVIGIIAALASTLLKIGGDLRLLSSGPDAGFGEIRLPPRQAGSSIMPGKINPVIPEAVQQVALRILAAQQTVSLSCGLGNLQINQFLPLIADEFLQALLLATRACEILSRNCLRGLSAQRERCRAQVHGAVATATALVGTLGYQQVSQLTQAALLEGRTVRELVLGRGLLNEQNLATLLSPESVNRLGS